MISRYQNRSILRVGIGRPATFDSPKLRKLKSAVTGNAELDKLHYQKFFERRNLQMEHIEKVRLQEQMDTKRL